MKILIYVLAGMLVIGIIFQLERWKWQECRQVGHGFWYCLSEQSK